MAAGRKTSLAKENEGLRAQILDLKERHEKEKKELKTENTNLLTEMSQLDCAREDLQEKLHRQTHALERELHDSRAVLHQQVETQDLLQKECKELKTLIRDTTPDFAAKLKDMKDDFPVHLHAVFKGVTEQFVRRSIEEVEKAVAFLKVSVSEWTDEQEVAELAGVVVFFFRIDNESSVDDYIKSVSALGRIAILVPLAENEGPLSVKSSSMLPISSTLIQIDVRASDGCLSSHYVNKIVDTCKVARFTAALSLISS
ncbi:uncharacterized protein LOC134193306 isoform X2 [Corticium candelabrum]|uniref:uncharacterized protein LOC134193306 isoform X2 n=1 Tax=Corticium candelabrum TaxID=121492 RepID=UPI002E2588A1|nr:uncharacterized protein LOC134193306 isoform X2 [Corticium candelabrum]